MSDRYFVYILASRYRGTLYVGVTSDIVRRLHQHRSRVGSRFATRYMVRRLVHLESTASPRDAIAREKEIKRWTRAKKLALIESVNPDWADLAATLFGDDEPGPLSGR